MTDAQLQDDAPWRRLVAVAAFAVAVVVVFYLVGRIVPDHEWRIRLRVVTIAISLFLLTTMAIWLTGPRGGRKPALDDLNKLRSSIVEYAAAHRFAFVGLLGCCGCTFALFAFTALGTMSEKEAEKALGDISLALFAGFVTAFMVLVLSDYASKHFLKEQVVDKGFNSIADALQASPVFLNNFLLFGLVAWPSMQHRNIRAEQDLQDYLSRVGSRRVTINVMNESGERWLAGYDGGGALLEQLVHRPVNLRVVVYSPFLEAATLLMSLGHQLDPDSVSKACRHIDRERCRLSRGTWVEILRMHKGFANAIEPGGEELHVGKLLEVSRGRDVKAQVELRISARRLPCEFHCFELESVYAAFPMHRDRNKFSDLLLVHAYPAARNGQKEVVGKFQAEFMEYWNSALTVSSYMREHGQLIDKVLALNAP